MVGTLLRLLGVRRVNSTRPPGYLTWAEIEAKYPGEWVLLDEPTVDRRWDELTGGRLRLHTPSLEEFNARLFENRTPNMAVRYVFTDADRTSTDSDVISVWTDDSTPP